MGSHHRWSGPLTDGQAQEQAFTSLGTPSGTLARARRTSQQWPRAVLWVIQQWHRKKCISLKPTFMFTAENRQVITEKTHNNYTARLHCPVYIYNTTLGQQKNEREKQRCKEEFSQKGKFKNRIKYKRFEERQTNECTKTGRRQFSTTTTKLPVINSCYWYGNASVTIPWEKYPDILCECMWILTWAWDRTRGSRLNNFYKKGKGKKKENIWELITHGRQIQNETANSHATDTHNDFI